MKYYIMTLRTPQHCAGPIEVLQGHLLEEDQVERGLVHEAL